MKFGRQSFCTDALRNAYRACYCFLLGRGIFGSSQIPQTINFHNDNVDKNVVPRKK